MTRIWLLILCALSLVSCTSMHPFSRVSYDATFAMATCGNVLNPDIYHPDVGPEGFVSYRSLFTKGFELKLERDFKCVFAYQIEGGELIRDDGTYSSVSANMGNMRLNFADKEFVLTWPNYYQMVLEYNITHPDTGEQLHVVALLHSSNIFST